LREKRATHFGVARVPPTKKTPDRPGRWKKGEGVPNHVTIDQGGKVVESQNAGERRRGGQKPNWVKKENPGKPSPGGSSAKEGTAMGFKDGGKSPSLQMHLKIQKMGE